MDVMKTSKFGQKIQSKSGISVLMDDLCEALDANSDMLMLGGGNPAHIPDVQRVFRKSVANLLEKDGDIERLLGNYDPSQGNLKFISSIAKLLRSEFGWDVTEKNIALTNGSQSSFFMLFNIFAGDFADGSHKKILLPLAPEYIGYYDVGISEDMFVSYRPEIEFIDEHTFKYHIDFDRLKIGDDIGAICVSRPTNPTGNVLTDDEIEKLSRLSKENDVPLIIDNAYGTPFPNMIFTEAKPVWDENIVVCMSLSKFGLPGTRTGIVIANEDIIEMVCEVNAVMNLCPSRLGAAIANDMVRSGEILNLSEDIIKPFYERKAKRAVELLHKELAGADYAIHKPEGALFLWLWIKGLGIMSHEFYERLKKRGVLVVPGNYFFLGLKEEWTHKDQCIRLNHSQDDGVVEKAIKIIAEEIKHQ